MAFLFPPPTINSIPVKGELWHYQALPTRVVFGVKERLIADFKIVDNPKLAAERGLPNPFREVTWDVIMSKTSKAKR